MVYATLALFAILATLVTGGYEEKQLYELIDKEIKMNKRNTSKTEIAIAGQFTKMAISSK